jgi:hypothetical protein
MEDEQTFIKELSKITSDSLKYKLVALRKLYVSSF